jgi:PAS domain S-box-containing protein
MEKRYLCKDGSIAWVNVNMTVIRDAAGRPTRTMATIENVSERKRAEMERARLTTAMEQAVELIMITDAQGRILYVNPAFEKVTGYTRDEVMGQTPRFLKSGKQEAGYYQAMWQALSQGRVWHGRFTNRKKNGELYEEDSTISPVRNHAGEIVNYVAVKRDITREVELESQIRQSQKMEGIGQLAGGVAHDFNNILAAIMMQAQLAETIEGVPDKVAEDMVQIRLSCERGANLTRQLLLFSRKQILQLRDLNLNDIVTNITKMLKRIIGENVAIQLRLHRGPLMTHADAGMLDQVLMNLAVNGRDAMDAHGQLTIGTAEIVLDEETAARYPDAAPGRYVCLSVSDTGAGIPPAVLPRIFEPFFTTKAQGKGTGLGLATVFGIVKQHKGWIQVRTELGRGTTFDIYLPAVSAAQNAIAEAGVEARRAKGSGTILMAEDDAGVRATTRKFLELHGYTILEAGNGAEALAIWENSSARVDLLLTDLLMPGGINGRDLARQLCGERPDLKVVFFSGYSADLVGGGLVLRLGENFLQKPFTPSSLLEILRRRLGA